jgi:hypothetical protein
MLFRRYSNGNQIMKDEVVETHSMHKGISKTMFGKDEGKIEEK